ncbi:MAG: VCBS repeat-containing protein [Nitrospirae bacterium]|nr:VCBS repeat-containing protein [Nitrospirota bacterium]
MRRSISKMLLVVLALVLCTATNAYSGRFKDNGDGSMMDTITGLQWMKNANACNDWVTWNEAFTCVASGWRLPTIKELYTLCRTDGSKTGLNIDATTRYFCNGQAVDRASQLASDGFTNVQSGGYWSSSSCACGASGAWTVAMSSGGVVPGGQSATDGKSSFNFVWPVRSGQGVKKVKDDFDGDGKSDILWQNTLTGDVYLWLMNGTKFSSLGSPGKTDYYWQVVGVGDFNGDGKADILFQNYSTGDIGIWLMNGTKFSSLGSPGETDYNWQIAGVGDFDGDGKSDILWQNASTSEFVVWLMNGTSYTSVFCAR